MATQGKELVQVAVGDPVIISFSSRSTNVAGRVVKVRRVWVEIMPNGSNRIYEYRRDDQTDGSTVGAPGRFYTMAQWEQRERLHAALDSLRRHGVTLAHGSPWRGREVDLAWLLDSSASAPEPAPEVPDGNA